MADVALVHRPALAGVETGTFGAVATGGPGVRLSAKPEGRLLHVLAAPGEQSLGAELARQGVGAVRFVSPGQWLIASDEAAGPDVLAALAELVGERAAISDQSHGRVRIGLDGPRAADLLSKGTAVDLHPGAFPVGSSTATLMGRIGVNLARDGEDAFELVVLRGFAESLWKDLVTMGLEYGIDCRGPV